MFKKILIANRGEISVRIIRACRDLNISPVAVYSEADRDALHVQLSDEAYPIGEAPAPKSYLAIEKLIECALKNRVDAIHPGYGFLSENAEFAESCRQAGLTFIGPSSESIRAMGDKMRSREVALSAGVPVIPGTQKPVATWQEALTASETIGYPVLIKASAGGGGKGMRLATSADEVKEGFTLAQAEAKSSFGNPTVYLERRLSQPRHIEIQLLGDQMGHIIHLGERECSIQRRHQKVLEESPSPVVNHSLREALGQAALKVARAIQYEGAGTIEFLVERNLSTDDSDFFFLEMNTRLQVEHPVTEMVTGVDIVQEQIRISAGEPLSISQEELSFRGWAIECRVYAESPENNYAPSPGQIEYLQEPAGPGIRNDSGVRAGDEITIHYDPLISKLVAWGIDRDQAVRRLRRALSEYRIHGVITNLPLFRRLLSDRNFLQGSIHTDFLGEFGASEGPDLDSVPPPVLAVSALATESQNRSPVASGKRDPRWRGLAWNPHRGQD